MWAWQLERITQDDAAARVAVAQLNGLADGQSARQQQELVEADRSVWIAGAMEVQQIAQLLTGGQAIEPVCIAASVTQYAKDIAQQSDAGALDPKLRTPKERRE